MSRCILSSDWHLAFSMPFEKTSGRGISTRLEEIIASVKWAIETGKKEHCSYFITLGDTFDRAERLATKEGLVIKDLFEEIKKSYDGKFIASVGNHDQISADSNILDLFSPGINVISSPKFLDVPGARLFFLPYIRESEDFYAAVSEFKKYDCPGNKYLFAHFWDTSVMSLDTDAIDPAKADFEMFTKVFTGHFHVPSGSSKDKVIYTGTLLNKKFSETGPKGVWILDTTKGSLKFVVNPLSPEFFAVQDSTILTDTSNIIPNAYYRVYCDPENVLEATKALSITKGFELLSKQSDQTAVERVSIMNVEKRNSASFKDYVLANCGPYIPEGVTAEEFKTAGASFLGNL